jgi:DNA-binding response OmpR family regulator
MGKVLVVDDDEDLLEMVSMILRSDNLEVKSLSEGSLFFNTLTTEKPSMIVMDIFLGAIDGRQLCREMKSDPNYASIPVLLYSAGNITESSIFQSGADDFIHKPFDMASFIRRVRLMLADKK